MRIISQLVSALLLCLFPVSAFAQAKTLRQEVESLHADMVAAFRKDPPSVAAFYADDASILGGGGRYIGREQIDQYWRQGIGGAEWSLEVLEVGGDSVSPWVRGRSVMQSPRGRQVMDYVGILKRQPDGRLKFYIDMFVNASPGMVRRAPGGLE